MIIVTLSRLRILYSKLPPQAGVHYKGSGGHIEILTKLPGRPVI